jgi:hypothetical protein
VSSSSHADQRQQRMRDEAQRRWRKMSEEVKLDWSSAEVHDGKLVISLEGKLQKGWADAFKRTTRLLNRGTWDEVTVKKGRVVVQPIAPGQEDRVRHFLESVVLQANSAISTPEEANAEREEDTNDSEDQEAREAPEDQAMTERLRSFAEAENRS